MTIFYLFLQGFKNLYIHLHHQIKTNIFIMESLKIRIQCPSEKTKTVGTFLTGVKTGKQYTKTYSSCVELFESSEYQILKNRIK